MEGGDNRDGISVAKMDGARTDRGGDWCLHGCVDDYFPYPKS